MLDSGTGEHSLDRIESALRARSVVVLLQLAELQRTENEVVPRALPSGKLRRVADLKAYLLDQLGRINAAWVRDRQTAGAAGDGAGEAPPPRRLAAALNAERAYAEVGKDPDLACFLAAGASISSERFRAACRAIAAVFDIALAPQAALPFARPSLPRRLSRQVATSTPRVRSKPAPATVSEQDT